MGNLAPMPPREAIAAAVETLVAVLDAIDGDPDVETNGDELDGDGSEDDFMLHGHDDGAGCPVSDPGEEDGEDCCEAGDDDPTDLGCLGSPGSIARHYAGGIIDTRPGDPDDAEVSAWTEWHTRGRQKLDRYGSESVRARAHGNMAHEDDEDDDNDTCAAGDDLGTAATGPVVKMGWDCPLGDDGAETDDGQ